MAARQDFGEGHRPVIEDIDADVVLARQFLQLAVRMAVDVDCALGAAMPGPKRIMAEHDQAPVDHKLDVMRDAGPGAACRHRGRIIVADDEVLAAVERRKPCFDSRRIHGHGKIAEVIDVIVRTDDFVPAGDQRSVVLADRLERALVDAEAASIAKMRIAGEVDGHEISMLRVAAGQRLAPLTRNAKFRSDRRDIVTLIPTKALRIDVGVIAQRVPRAEIDGQR